MLSSRIKLAFRRAYYTLRCNHHLVPVDKILPTMYTKFKYIDDRCVTYDESEEVIGLDRYGEYHLVHCDPDDKRPFLRGRICFYTETGLVVDIVKWSRLPKNRGDEVERKKNSRQRSKKVL